MLNYRESPGKPVQTAGFSGGASKSRSCCPDVGWLVRFAMDRSPAEIVVDFAETGVVDGEGVSTMLPRRVFVFRVDRNRLTTKHADNDLWFDADFDVRIVKIWGI